MTETRTHEASPRTLARASARGDVARSPELVSAAVFGATALCVGVTGSGVMRAFGTLVHVTGLAIAGVAAGGDGVQSLAAPLWQLLQQLVPLLACVPAAALAAGLLQSGFWVGVPSRPDWLARLRRGLSWDGMLGAGSSLLKLALLVGVLAHALYRSVPGVFDSWQRAPGELAAIVGLLARALLWRAVLALALVGAIEFVLQLWRRRRRLRMSTRELRDEQRASEGDPHLRAERRRRAAALTAAATLQELDRAALVVHGAQGRLVALRFDAEHDAAPVLWLKAEGELALRVLARAAEHGLPCHDDAALCEQLFRLEISQSAPEGTHVKLAQLWVLEPSRAPAEPSARAPGARA